MINLFGSTVLFVPGLRDHVEDHWQTHSALALPGSHTVPPLEIGKLSRATRVAALQAAIAKIPGDVLLVAHSAGCLTVAWWAATFQLDPIARRVRGALLVTPPDIERELPASYPTYDDFVGHDWLPIPSYRLPFDTRVVASQNDPLADFGRVAEFAGNWGGLLYDAGRVGHLNPASGFGPWPEALPLIEWLASDTRREATGS